MIRQVLSPFSDSNGLIILSSNNRHFVMISNIIADFEIMRNTINIFFAIFSKNIYANAYLDKQISYICRTTNSYIPEGENLNIFHTTDISICSTSAWDVPHYLLAVDVIEHHSPKWDVLRIVFACQHVYTVAYNILSRLSCMYIAADMHVIKINIK